jgi:hypothetical protein
MSKLIEIDNLVLEMKISEDPHCAFIWHLFNSKNPKKAKIEQQNFMRLENELPITVARSSTGIVGSNLTWNMDVCMRLFCVRVVLCIGSGLATGSSPVQGALPIVYRINKLKKRTRPKEDL